MAVFLLLTAVLLGTVGVWTGSAFAASSPAPRCNGSARLCDLSLGSVAFATTHNSMSSPADKFVGPNQGEPIAAQLKHGIRGFQIDAYLGTPRDRGVYTDVAGPFGSQATDLPPALVTTAGGIRRALGAPPPGTPDDVYLCHTFCELGGVPMITVAREFHAFLVSHPDDVLVVVIEDYVPPERERQVLRDAGLEPMLLTFQPGRPLPTLGEMVRSKHRLFVSLENEDGGPTLTNAFKGPVQETSFTFLRPSELTNAASCRSNRGTDGAPVFQFNHWLTPPARTTAKLVNTTLLRDRVTRCTAARGRTPTLVAVDFAESSDVVSVVDRLNRGEKP